MKNDLPVSKHSATREGGKKEHVVSLKESFFSRR